MSQCASGSQAQPGAPVYFQFDSTTVATFLPFAASIAWLGFLALPIGPVDTAKFCSLEPPATSMSATDWVSLGFPLIAKRIGAYDRLADYIRQQAFATYCVCSSTSSGTYAPWILSLGPRWYFKLGEAVGATVALDSSPHGWTAAYSGTTLGQAALMSGDSATSALIPNGSARVDVGHSTGAHWLGSASASIEFWAKIPAAPGVVSIIYDNYNGTNPLVRIDMRTTGKVLIFVRDSAGTSLTSADSSASVADGLVHQFDLVLNAAAHTITLYIDAVSACSISGLSTNAYSDSLEDNYLGGDPSSGSLGVGMTAGHYSWFDFALSATQISDNKAAAGGTTIYQPPTYTPPPDGTPTGGTPPTCSTSQDVCNQLFLTDQLLLGLSTQLSMFQARERPQFYRVESMHVGLTGSGVLTVLDILGLRVQLTTVPSSWGSTAETPRRLIPAAGSIQAGISGEYTDNFQLHYEDEILMLGTSWASQVRYNLRPGIVATLTELVPGG